MPGTAPAGSCLRRDRTLCFTPSNSVFAAAASISAVSLAISVAQVDEMSGGRIELGLGAGWFDDEHHAYGIPFPPRRFDLFEEQLEVMTGLWATAEGQTFDHQGTAYRLTQSPALPKPVQPQVPVIIGGGGQRRTPALAARFATEFNIGFQPEDKVADAFERVRQACVDAGRQPDSLKLSVALPTVVGRDDAHGE